MSVKELKEKIKRQIDDIDDELRLKDLSNFLEEDSYELTDEQMQGVEEARAQYRRGEYLTDEEAEKEMDEWLDAK